MVFPVLWGELFTCISNKPSWRTAQQCPPERLRCCCCAPQVLLQTPCRARKALQQRFLKGRLAELAQHPIANFVVQALVASVVRAPEASLETLLFGSRGP